MTATSVDPLRRLFADFPLAMAIVGPDLRLAEVNAAYCRLTGYSAAELADLTFSDITHPDDVASGLDISQRVFAGDVEGLSLDKRYVRKTGEVVWVELTISALGGGDAGPLRSLAIVQDISERRRALEDAQAELDRLARDRDRILQSAGEGIYHVDGRGRLTFVNPAAARMLGWPAEALEGKPAHELLHHTRADGRGYPRAECPIHGPGGAGRAVETVTDDLFWRRDGTSFPVLCRSAPVRGPEAAGVVVVFTDVSERVRMEAALREAQEHAARERLRATEAERARWARELHDETLQGLAALHVLLAPEAEGEGARQRIAAAQEHIENEMEKLRGLISELRPAALDELGLEASVLDLVERTQAVYGLDVDTAIGLPASAAPRPTATDVETAAYRIVQEALSNAARHAGAGRVTVVLEQADGALTVRIADDGEGFDPTTGAAGFGLRGMRERADACGGRVDAGAEAGRWRVDAEVPA
jgi:PAS domain S-box-containing protein